MADNTLLSTNVGIGDIIRTLEDGSSVKWPVGVVAYATSTGTPDVLTIPIAAALADDTANPTTLIGGSCILVYDGATWDRAPGNSTDGLLVNLGENNDVTVTGTVAVSGTVTVGAHAVTNAGTFAVQVDGAALTSLQLLDDIVSGSGVNVSQMNGVNVSMGNGASGTGVLRVTLANDSTGIIATVGAVTAITNALPAGTNAIGKLAANSGVDIGDVDVTSIAAGDNNIGNVDIVTVPSDPFGANADAASATGSISAKLRFIAATGIPITGTVTVASHAVTNAGTFVVQVDGSALTALQLIDDVIFADDAAFTPGTSKVAAIGLQSDETATDSVDEGDIGCPRMTLDRKQIVTPQPHSKGGLSAAVFLSDASTKAGVVKNAAGQLYGFSSGNINASPCYVRLYNMTTNPATSDTPVYRFLIPGNTAGGGREKAWPMGLEFSTGIAYRITTGAADNNDTATASAEVTLNFDYK